MQSSTAYNLAAGAITAGVDPTEAALNACREEASLDPMWVKDRIQPMESFSYVTNTEKMTEKMTCKGWWSKERLFEYDLELGYRLNTDTDLLFQPRINESDGEVEWFHLFKGSEVIRQIAAGEWRGFSALVTIRFLMRRNRITKETDPKFDEMVKRFRGDVTESS